MTISPSTFPVLRLDASATDAAHWILRAGAAACFIGHGAFGFITKAAWLPYFGVVGIPERVAWQLMPWVGAVDILAGMAVLFAPSRIPLVYMIVWGFWTALLRPLAGESFFEALERAGNYGVPLAFLMIAFGAAGRGDSLERRTRERVLLVLRATTSLLLLGHGMLGVAGKPMLDAHYAAVGLPASATPIVGWIEVLLAIAVAARPWPALLGFVALWKVTTESLFVVSGDRTWEFVERAGSYAAPLALAVLIAIRASDDARVSEYQKTHG